MRIDRINQGELHMNTRKLAGVGIITTALIGTALTSGAVTATAAPAGAATKATTASTAAAAPHYWRFKSKQTGTCLSDSSSHVASVRPCSGSAYQKWDWVPGMGAYDLLQNKATHRCLRSVLHTPEAKVTTVKCNKKAEGVLWAWYAKFGMIDGVSNQTGMRTILVTKKKGSRAVFALGQNNPAGSHGLRWSHLN